MHSIIVEKTLHRNAIINTVDIGVTVAAASALIIGSESCNTKQQMAEKELFRRQNYVRKTTVRHPESFFW